MDFSRRGSSSRGSSERESDWLKNRVAKAGKMKTAADVTAAQIEDAGLRIPEAPFVTPVENPAKQGEAADSKAKRRAKATLRAVTS